MLLQTERGSLGSNLRHRPTASTKSKLSQDVSSTRSLSSTSIESGSEAKNAGGTVLGAKKDAARDSKVMYEFGGPLGVSALMVGFPILMLYFYLCLTFHRGHLQNPLSQEFWVNGLPSAVPTYRATMIYMLFNVFQWLTAATLPGVKVLGLPVPSLGGKQLEYLCNGVATWYVDLALVAALHFTGVFPITIVIDEVGPIMSVAMIWGIIVTIGCYVAGRVTRRDHRMSGSIPYDMFMGAILNPRIGNVDLKMWSEIRIPWKLLFFVSLSAAVKDHEINLA
jgi:Delta24(24(1))-sterol reductase